MAFVPVLKYEADWNPKVNLYRIRVTFAGGSQPVVVPINSESEFVAVLLMLGKAGVLLDTSSGDLQLPARPVGT
jgi:hypothetical protein